MRFANPPYEPNVVFSRAWCRNVGQYFARAPAEIGMADEVARKAVLVPGSSRIVVAVAKREAAVGITFRGAVVTTPDLKFAGALADREPFTAGVLKNAKGATPSPLRRGRRLLRQFAADMSRQPMRGIIREHQILTLYQTVTLGGRVVGRPPRHRARMEGPVEDDDVKKIKG